MREKQKTILEEVLIKGVSVYNGKSNSVLFMPSQADTGLSFIVNDEKIPVNLDKAVKKKRGIAISGKYQEVLLTEHILSVVYALGIDNLTMKLNSNICPTLPNCANEYFLGLEEHVVEQNMDKKYWELKKDFYLNHKEKIRYFGN